MWKNFFVALTQLFFLLLGPVVVGWFLLNGHLYRGVLLFSSFVGYVLVKAALAKEN